MLWQDKALVHFLTTVHSITNEEGNYKNRNRRRPHITPGNHELIFQGRGGDSARSQLLPQVSVDYSNFMGGVDIADQQRCYYDTQFRACRNWMLLFFWLIDTTVINVFLLSRGAIPHPPRSEPFWKHHGSFRTRLAWNLVLSGIEKMNPDFARKLQTNTNPKSNGKFCLGAAPRENTTGARKDGYVGENFLLPARRFLLYDVL